MESLEIFHKEIRWSSLIQYDDYLVIAFHYCNRYQYYNLCFCDRYPCNLCLCLYLCHCNRYPHGTYITLMFGKRIFFTTEASCLSIQAKFANTIEWTDQNKFSSWCPKCANRYMKSRMSHEHYSPCKICLWSHS